MKYEKAILDHLLDKYERSKSFTGDNQKSQSFSVKLAKLYPKYEDEAEYELLRALDQTVMTLENAKFISSKRKKNGIVESITLNIGAIDAIYTHISRIPKSDLNERLLRMLDLYSDSNDVLFDFCNSQKERLSKNKKVEFFDGNPDEYEKLLKAVAMVYEVEDETYIRDFSIKVFGDSKVFESIMGKVKRLLFQYGDFPEEDTVLENLNIIKNPGHVYIKGSAVITINGQKIDISKFKGDIALSSMLLSQIDSIQVTGKRVITIENLTTFNSFNKNDDFVVYLGGYHNSHRRKFIMQIYHDNPCVMYRHFGDIDAGGFYILLHLREKTGVNFEPYHMGIAELQEYSKYTKPLTDNDIKRLRNLLNGEFSDVVNFMLEHNCKLEQEAIDI